MLIPSSGHYFTSLYFSKALLRCQAILYHNAENCNMKFGQYSCFLFLFSFSYVQVVRTKDDFHSSFIHLIACYLLCCS